MSIWSRIERRLTDLAGELIPDEFRQQLVSVRDRFDKGEYDRVARDLDALLAERPDHVGALTLMGMTQTELGDHEAALGFFDRACAADPELPDPALGAGEARLMIGQWADAIAPLRSAVANAGGDREMLANAYRGLGMAYRHNNELDKAIRELRKAVAEAPSDPGARALLGEALLADDRVSNDEAKRHLEAAAESDEAPPITFIALGRIALHEGDLGGADATFERALKSASASTTATSCDEIIEAHLGLGDADLSRSDATAAHQHYLQALELGSKRHRVHARIGDVHRMVGDHAAAASSYQLALELGAETDVLHRALEVAVLADDLTAAVQLANRALEADPSDPRALVARGTAMAREGQVEPARATFHVALENGDDFEARVALGRLALDSETGKESGVRAATEALAALRLRPRDARGRQLLADARARELSEVSPDPGPDDDAMYQLAMELHALTLARPEMSSLAADCAQAAADFDQPLLVTVMGEFSSGKSTFVNAFIGADVAPTGITPTTATINVVKYGRERGGRIVFQDGHVESMGWDELFAALRAMDTARARLVRVVEILLPLEQLERVNIVDTPGLNSILPEHEHVARAFIARADAVVWLFTANQAGKKTEREALSAIRGEGKRVLGVLNKRDQLSSADAEQVIEYVTQELDDLVEVVVPFSAREALVHRTSEASGPDGNYGTLAAALEERFFTQARKIKREAAGRRLGNLVRLALETADEERSRAAGAAATLSEAAHQIREATDAFPALIARERQNINAWVAELCRQAAREVLELVRPRRIPFGSHSATPADRDYLISLLDGGYEAALLRSKQRVTQRLLELGAQATSTAASIATVVGAEAAADLARTSEAAARLVEASVFARCQAYLRGYLRGGYVDSFFRRDLPKIDLDEDAVYHALYRDAPNLDAEIAVPLEEAGAAALEALVSRLEHWAAVAEVMAYDIEVGTARALDGIDARRRSVLG